MLLDTTIFALMCFICLSIFGSPFKYSQEEVNNKLLEHHGQDFYPLR